MCLFAKITRTHSRSRFNFFCIFARSLHFLHVICVQTYLSEWLCPQETRTLANLKSKPRRKKKHLWTHTKPKRERKRNPKVFKGRSLSNERTSYTRNSIQFLNETHVNYYVTHWIVAKIKSTKGTVTTNTASRFASSLLFFSFGWTLYTHISLTLRLCVCVCVLFSHRHYSSVQLNWCAHIHVFIFEVVGVRSRTNKRTVAWTNKWRKKTECKKKQKTRENARKSSFYGRKKTAAPAATAAIRIRGKKARQTFFMDTWLLW